MNQAQRRLARLATDIFTTNSDEIHCELVGDLMVLSAEAGLTEEESRRRYPGMWRHFQVCADCHGEFNMLNELTHLERTSALGVATAVPPVPATRTSTPLWTEFAEAIRAVFSGFSPAMQAGLTRGESLGVEPVNVSLADGRVIVELDVEANERNPDQRDLFCHVESIDDRPLEAVPLWLQVGGDGPIIAEQALDEFGDTFFSDLEPGDYTLWLRLGQQAYSIQAITLP